MPKFEMFLQLLIIYFAFSYARFLDGDFIPCDLTQLSKASSKQMNSSEKQSLSFNDLLEKFCLQIKAKKLKHFLAVYRVIVS